MRLTIEVETSGSDKVFVTIRKAEADGKEKKILSYPFDRQTALSLVHAELATVLDPNAKAVRS